MVTSDTDFVLLQRFADRGDPAAFAEIVRRYAGVVFAACQRILRDASQAEDVAQETFYRLMRSPRSVTQSLGAWLHRAATHLAVDVIRSESARHRREQEYAALPRRDASTWQELSPSVDEAMADLPEQARALLVRHFLQGVSQSDLAIEQRVSPATMSRRMRSAIELLQRALKENGLMLAVGALPALMGHAGGGAAPATLVRELGKMSLWGAVRHAAARVGPARPLTLKSFLGTLAIVAASFAAGFLVAYWPARPPAPPQRTYAAPAATDPAPAAAPAATAPTNAP